MLTRKPAASRTLTAALAVEGWKWLLKVSGQRRTGGAMVVSAEYPRLAKEARPFDRLRAGRGAPDRSPSKLFPFLRLWNQALNVSGAKAGMERWWGIPAINFVRSRRNGSWVVRLTRPGA